MRKLRLLVLLVACTAVTAIAGFNGAASAQDIEPACEGRNNHAIYDLDIFNPPGQSNIENEDAELSGSGVICGTVVEPDFSRCGDTSTLTMNNRVNVVAPPGDTFNNTSTMSVGRFVGSARVNVAVCTSSIYGMSGVYTVDPVILTVDSPDSIDSECPSNSVACYKAAWDVSIQGYDIPGRGWIWVTESGGKYTLTLGPFGLEEELDGVSVGLTRIHNFTLCRNLGSETDNTCNNSPSQPWIHRNGDQSTDPPPSCTNGPSPPTGPNGLFRAGAISNAGDQSSEATDCVEWEPVNEPPECDDMPSLNVESGGTIRFNLTCTDPDGDSMFFDKGSVSHGQVSWINQATGRVEYISNGDGAFSDSFTFKAKDPLGSNSWSNTATATIFRLWVDAWPTCGDMNLQGAPGEQVQFNMSSVCRSPLEIDRYEIYFRPGENTCAGSVTWSQSGDGYVLPNNDCTAPFIFHFWAIDINGTWSAEATATTIVNHVPDNHSPICQDIELQGSPGDLVPFDISPPTCTDPDGNGQIDQYELLRVVNLCDSTVTLNPFTGEGDVLVSDEDVYPGWFSCNNTYGFHYRVRDIHGAWSHLAMVRVTIVGSRGGSGSDSNGSGGKKKPPKGKGKHGGTKGRGLGRRT